ncbi:MAG: hypothetical protein FWC42_00930 [Proteobacteria bacterium]|nr:hypothetical protein [Pseudomonadota bacterium]
MHLHILGICSTFKGGVTALAQQQEHTASRRTISARARQGALGLLAAVTLMISSTYAGNLPDGWAARAENNGVTFAPVRMSPGEKLEIWVADALYETPQDGSPQNRLLQIRRQAGAMQGDKCEPAEITQAGVVTQGCTEGNAALQYMLLPSPAGGNKVQLLRIRAAGGEGVMTRYGEGFQQTLQSVMRGQTQAMLRNDNQVQTQQRRQSQPEAQPQRARQEQLERGYAAQGIRTAPGQGVRDSDIAAVFVSAQVVHNPGETVKRDLHTTWLLFKDGTGYQNEIPPDELNVKVSRQLEPQRWVQWRKPLLGSSYEIRGPGDSGWRSLSNGKGWFAQPARSGERLNGVYERTDGWGNQYSLRIKRTTWRFSGDGAFDLTLYGYGGITQSGGGTSFSHISETQSDAKGTRRKSGTSSSSARIGAASSDGVSTNAARNTNDGASRRGRYRLNGWVLEAERDDGQLERHFVTFQGSDRAVIDIDSAPLYVKKQ